MGMGGTAMNLLEFIKIIATHIYPFESLGSSLLFLAILFCTVVQVSPIKINPWDKLLGWIGDRFNSGMNKRIDALDKRVGQMEANLDEHIQIGKDKDLKNQRRYIINFVNEGINGIRHSKESFEDAIKACDFYEEYITKNNIQNGVISSSIRAIRLKYEEHLLANDFPADDYYIGK